MDGPPSSLEAPPPSPRAHAAPTGKSAGLEKFTPYTFRHYFCSRATESGSNPQAIKKMIGHTPSSRVLEKHYQHLSQPFIDVEVAKIKIV
ncbi:MAG: tyrosine-type recombinase/integrase [Kiritimatiellae bacterium]|nr:tyrosine-type recombinase/integrase [Kiritimatiellia bacterium]